MQICKHPPSNQESPSPRHQRAMSKRAAGDTKHCALHSAGDTKQTSAEVMAKLHITTTQREPLHQNRLTHISLCISSTLPPPHYCPCLQELAAAHPQAYATAAVAAQLLLATAEGKAEVDTALLEKNPLQLDIRRFIVNPPSSAALLTTQCIKGS